MGDVAGVGPEIIVRTLADTRVREWCRPLVLGDAGALDLAAKRLKIDPSIRILDHTEAAGVPDCRAALLRLSRLSNEDLAPGRPTAAGAAAAAQYIAAGAKMALEGRLDGLVTAPISKEALRQAGYRFPGHTEMLADLAGGPPVVMMLAGPKLRVVLVTIHVALRDVPALLSVERIVTTADITHRSLQQYFGCGRPRLAAAALNPHAGEAGLFGREEEEVIAPAVALARRQGLDLSGPYPADSLFFRAAAGEFDAVVCMYHDQGLIPLKLLHFRDGVNITLGLPFIRTSVDHGTAYDLAGTGRADPASLLAAVRMAADMAGHQKRNNAGHPIKG